MKNFDLKKLIPHAIAVGVFLLVAIIFCKPALESNTVLKQSDVSNWQGMSQQSMEHKAATGHFPLWNISMFSGMPAYQIAMDGYWTPLGIIDKAFQLWLPKPMNFFFLACICFYFLCICLRIRPYAAILGALAFAYCSYTPIIITAGHDTKMLALAYSPALMGAAILLFDKKYLAGFSLAALFAALQIGQGHQQISYYLLLILIIMTISFIIKQVREKQTAGLVKTLSLLVVAGIFGVAVDAIGLFPAADYVKDSKRGGQLVMDSTAKTEDKVVNGKTTGLSKQYAFQWSYGAAESMSLMFPGVKSYGLHYAVRDNESYMFPQLKEDANVVSYVTGLFPQAPAEQIAQQMSQALYWGDQPFTNGPVYLGAVICFLFLLGMFYLDGKHKWWILTASVLGILLALGSNFMGFNGFLFDHLPFYNKFRVPTMALVIPQLLFPVMAALTLNKLWDNTDAESWRKFKYGVIATGAAFALVLGFYFSTDFGNENKQRTAAFNEMMASKGGDAQQKYNVLNEKFESKKDNGVYENWVMNLRENPDGQKVARQILTDLKKDRAALLMKDILFSLLFVLLAAAIIALYLKGKINALLMLVGVSIVAMIDLFAIDTKYLNEKSFDSKDSYESSEFPLSNADRTILADKDPNFRVFNASVGSPFEESRTSYHHKSIGGYHAAKMGIYDDLSTYELGRGNPNIAVLNMLNAKWIITGEGDKIQAQQNPAALGNAWFVKAISFVNGPVAEMRALHNLNTKDSAITDESFKPMVTAFAAPDSAAFIKQTTFDNDAISYESSSNSSNAAVFSEIYYKNWNAYIDGKPAPVFKVNYLLRAMIIPAGKHQINFKFEPTVYFTSRMVSAISSWILMLLLIAAIAFSLKMKKD